MYIWDSDQATEDMKPQVSCFPWLAPQGLRRALADGCTDLYIARFYRTLWRAQGSLCTHWPGASVDSVHGVNIRQAIT